MALSTIGRNQLNTGIDDNSDATAITIDSSERVMMGTTTEGSAGADELTVGSTSGSNGITIRGGTTGSSSIYMSDATSGAGEYAGYIAYSHNSDSMAFGVSGGQKAVIDSSGKVGIGGTPTELLYLEANNPEFTMQAASDGGECAIYFKDDDGNKDGRITYRTDYAGQTDNYMSFYTNGSERMRIDSSGNVGIGTTTINDQLVVDSSSAEEGITVRGGGFDALKIGLVDPGTSNDGVIGMKISNALRFITNNSERMRVTNGGILLVGKTDTALTTPGVRLETGGCNFVRLAGQVILANRHQNDGSVIGIYQAGTQEGDISVSGSTVSYNGGHLSRWSQLTDGNRIDGLVKGTVMTNLDQMAVWHHEAQAATYYEEGDELPDGVSVGDEKTAAVAAYDEDNEQLNCMAVSSVEGDPNVAGVFVNWDDDDEDFTADMNVAMTGDMVIRIAQGTTVARGDLLMSAGDGTAKPQGDDIVRSKTIAKVTSTTVSHTYDDGSYLVPCVLMAC